MKNIFFSFFIFLFINNLSLAEEGEPLDNFYKRKKYSHIIGPKIGVCMSGLSNYGLQSYSCEGQYGLLGIFRFHKNFALSMEINYSRMGTKDTPLPIHFGINTDIENKKKGKKKNEEDEEKEAQEEIFSEYGKKILDIGKKVLVYKRDEFINISYITVPINFCIVFKNHKNSFITNYFFFGAQIGYAVKAEVIRYQPASVLFTKKYPKENIYWSWTKCKDCESTIDIYDKIDKFDFGLTFGYSFETDSGFIFGVKYYDGLKKVFVDDENPYFKQRKNYSLELYFTYNFLSFIKHQ